MSPSSGDGVLDCLRQGIEAAHEELERCRTRLKRAHQALDARDSALAEAHQLVAFLHDQLVRVLAHAQLTQTIAQKGASDAAAALASNLERSAAWSTGVAAAPATGRCSGGSAPAGAVAGTAWPQRQPAATAQAEDTPQEVEAGIHALQRLMDGLPPELRSLDMAQLLQGARAAAAAPAAGGAWGQGALAAAGAAHGGLPPAVVRGLDRTDSNAIDAAFSPEQWLIDALRKQQYEPSRGGAAAATDADLSSRQMLAAIAAAASPSRPGAAGGAGVEQAEAPAGEGPRGGGSTSTSDGQEPAQAADISGRGDNYTGLKGGPPTKRARAAPEERDGEGSAGRGGHGHGRADLSSLLHLAAVAELAEAPHEDAGGGGGEDDGAATAAAVAAAVAAAAAAAAAAHAGGSAHTLAPPHPGQVPEQPLPMSRGSSFSAASSLPAGAAALPEGTPCVGGGWEPAGSQRRGREEGASLKREQSVPSQLAEETTWASTGAHALSWAAGQALPWQSPAPKPKKQSWFQSEVQDKVAPEVRVACSSEWQAKQSVRVICGDLSGTFHMTTGSEFVIRLAGTGETISPNKFEELAGKKSARNWQQSIRLADFTMTGEPSSALLKLGHFTRIVGLATEK